MATHTRPLSHVSIGVRDLAVSKAFYAAILEPLGLQLVWDRPPCAGFGPAPDKEFLNIFDYGDKAQAPGPGCHLAFNAVNRQIVDRFHEEALRLGGKSAGGPGIRAHYGENYYAAFVICPDGWKIECVCQEPEGA